MFSFHDKYVGQIVFANQRLMKDYTQESLFKNTFNLGEEVYARVFTSNSVDNYIVPNKKI